MALSSGWALNAPFVIELSYDVEKKSIIPVRTSKEQVSESRGALYIDITFSDSAQKLKLVFWIETSVRKVDEMVLFL